MRTIPLTFDDAEYETLKKFRERVSKAKSWEKFVMEFVNGTKNKKRNAND